MSGSLISQLRGWLKCLMYKYWPANLWLKEEPIVWLIEQPIAWLTEMLNIFIEQPSCLGFFKGILFFWKSSDKTSLHIDVFMLLYAFACCSIYLLLYRFSCKMSKLVSKVVSKLPAEANVKSRRKTDEKILENNRAKTFHFLLPFHWETSFHRTEGQVLARRLRLGRSVEVCGFRGVKQENAFAV